ncbi:2-nitropropane dioxygenase, partial [Crassisporium funariophilum]
TSFLDIKTPIVSAPMAGASGGALAAHVTLGGGFGFLAVGYESPEAFREQLGIARTLLQGNEHSEMTLRIGVGFLGWLLEKPLSTALELIKVALENHVQAIWLSFSEDLGRWVKYVRENDPRAGSKDAVTIFVQISSVEQAQLALNVWKADIIVAQGSRNEAGGHGFSSSPPLMTLLPLIKSIIPPEGPPVLAAGGLATGAHVASLLTLGASGVVLGTRFLLSPQSMYTDSQRSVLIAADASMSVRSMAFDHVRNTLGWPQGVDGRGLRNATVEDYENGVDITVLRDRFAESARNGENNRMVVWAGSGVGLMGVIKPAQDIVVELHEECLQKIQEAALLVGHPL